MASRLLVLLLLSVVSVTAVSSCSCYWPPGQTDKQRYCSTDHVFLAYVSGLPVSNGWQNEYPALVWYISRDKNNLLSSSLDNQNKIKIRTGASSAACGVGITPFRVYLFSSSYIDNQQPNPYVSVNSCQWNQPVVSLTDSQLKGLITWRCLAISLATPVQFRAPAK